MAVVAVMAVMVATAVVVVVVVPVLTRRHNSVGADEKAAVVAGCSGLDGDSRLRLSRVERQKR